MPGRPREFDLDDALDRAMLQFWLRGYEATSLADLMDAMGIQKGSLYKAFGDKRSLFIAALTKYLSSVREGIAQALAPINPASRAIASLLTDVVAMSRSGSACRGCLAVNSLVELAPTDKGVAKLLADHFANLREQLEAAIARGQSAGEFRADESPEDLARVLTVFVAGLAANVKGGMPQREAHNAAHAAVRLIQT